MLVAAIRLFGPITIELAEKLEPVFEFALKIASAVPFALKRRTPFGAEITKFCFGSMAIDDTVLLVAIRPTDPGPPFSGWRNTLADVPTRIVLSTGSTARAVNVPVKAVNVESRAPSEVRYRLTPKAPAAKTYSTPPTF